MASSVRRACRSTPHMTRGIGCEITQARFECAVSTVVGRSSTSGATLVRKKWSGTRCRGPPAVASRRGTKSTTTSLSSNWPIMGLSVDASPRRVVRVAPPEPAGPRPRARPSQRRRTVGSAMLCDERFGTTDHVETALFALVARQPTSSARDHPGHIRSPGFAREGRRCRARAGIPVAASRPTAPRRRSTFGQFRPSIAVAAMIESGWR